ncbi:hypothetical protein Tco_1297018, partial [Tanacetum coccineum]
MMDRKDLFETKAKGRSDGKAKEKILVLIPETTFVGVESRVLIPETTFVGVESRVLIPETTFVGVESRVLIPETTVWDTLVYPSDTLVILTEEFRQRMMADALEKVAKASIGAQSTSVRTSARSKLRAERVAVHRQRALEKAVSQKTRLLLIIERGAKTLAEKEKRDLLAVKEQAERNRLAENLDADIKRWSNGKEKNLRLHNSILFGELFSVFVEYYGVRVSGQLEGIIDINMVSSQNIRVGNFDSFTYEREWQGAGHSVMGTEEHMRLTADVYHKGTTIGTPGSQKNTKK